MRSCCVIGNGPSRLERDLTQIKVTTLGCNALHRDFHPDWLGVIDSDMHKEVLESSYPNEQVVHRYRYRELCDWAYKGCASCGHMMVLWAIDQGFTPIFLLGMDMTSRTVYLQTNAYDARVPPDRRTDEWQLLWDKLISRMSEIYQVGPNSIEGIQPTSWEHLCSVPR